MLLFEIDIDIMHAWKDVLRCAIAACGIFGRKLFKQMKTVRRIGTSSVSFGWWVITSHSWTKILLHV